MYLPGNNVIYFTLILFFEKILPEHAEATWPPRAWLLGLPMPFRPRFLALPDPFHDYYRALRPWASEVRCKRRRLFSPRSPSPRLRRSPVCDRSTSPPLASLQPHPPPNPWPPSGLRRPSSSLPRGEAVISLPPR